MKVIEPFKKWAYSGNPRAVLLVTSIAQYLEPFALIFRPLVHATGVMVEIEVAVDAVGLGLD
jgi:hypothetical protein